MRRSRTTEWRHNKRLRAQNYEPSSNEDEDRLFREYNRTPARFSNTSTSGESTITHHSGQVSTSTYSTSTSNNAPSSDSRNGSITDSENMDVVNQELPQESETGTDDSNLETEDDDSEEEDRMYREYRNEEHNGDTETEEEEPFARLRNILCSDENVTLTVTVNKAELMLGGLKFGFKNELCQTGLADLFKYVNSILQTKLLPESRYLVDKIFNSSKGVEYHAVCPDINCYSYVGQFNRQDREMLCHVCRKVIYLKSPCYNNFFVVFDVANDCSNLIFQNWEHVYSVIQKRFQQYDTISDFCDGNFYKEFVRSLPPNERKNFVTATFNSDGAPVFESSQYSIWPVQMIINELSYNVRTSKTVTCGLWFGKVKPDMNVFLQPCVEMINRLSTIGIQVKVNNTMQNMKIHTLCCCVDSGARAPMQGIVQYNGYFGCSWCLHPGVYVPTLRGGCVKYVLLDELPPRRTELDMIQHIQLSIDSNVPVFGVKRPSCLINLKSFNVVNGFVPDDLHFADEGIGKQITGYWFDTINFPFSLSADEIKIVDRLLMQIKAPNQITRLSRGIKDRSWWKGIEWHNWICIYSIPILSQFPRMQPYVEHWTLFVEAYHIINTENITAAELQRAHEFFLEFMGRMEVLYSPQSMTYNVHQIQHVTQSIVDWGPSFAHSGYCFENGNGKLLKKILAAKGVLLQLCRSISMSQSEIILRQHLQNQPYSPLLAYIDYLDDKNAVFSRSNHAIYFGASTKSKNKWVTQLHLSRYSITFTKMVKDGCLYTTSRRKRIRSNNSYAITNNGTHVQLRDFIYDEDTELEYALCKIIDVFDVDNSLPIKRIVGISNNISAIETATISKICVYITNDSEQFICAVSNLHHN